MVVKLASSSPPTSLDSQGSNIARADLVSNDEEGAQAEMDADTVGDAGEDDEMGFTDEDEASEKRERIFLDDMVDSVIKVYQLFEKHGIVVPDDSRLKVKAVIYSYILEFMLHGEIKLPSGQQ